MDKNNWGYWITWLDAVSTIWLSYCRQADLLQFLVAWTAYPFHRYRPFFFPDQSLDLVPQAVFFFFPVTLNLFVTGNTWMHCKVHGYCRCLCNLTLLMLEFGSRMSHLCSLRPWRNVSWDLSEWWQRRWCMRILLYYQVYCHLSEELGTIPDLLLLLMSFYVQHDPKLGRQLAGQTNQLIHNTSAGSRTNTLQRWVHIKSSLYL